MAIAPERRTAAERPQLEADQQFAKWGGVAGLAGVALLACSVIVVVAAGLPDAADVETLTDFDSIETGRIAEHSLYLGALILFALSNLALYQFLRAGHQAAALFGTAVISIGFVIMAASSVLHVSTAPLAELYNSPDRSPEDLRAIEYAWTGAQSIFDTMLVTGLLLVPAGIALFGVAMRNAPRFGPRAMALTIGLGVIGFAAAMIEVIDTATDMAAASLLAVVTFQIGAGLRMLRFAKQDNDQATE